MAYGAGMLLLAAVAGYWVLERAEKHKGYLRRIGQLLGGFIIVVSLIGVACRVWALAMGKVSCPVAGWSCPYTKKSSTPSPQPK